MSAEKDTSADLHALLETLATRVAGRLRGSARLEIAEGGSIVLDSDGARIGDAEADVVMHASAAVFRAILDGAQNPVKAVMTGKLRVDGSARRALKVSDILTGRA